MPGLVAAAALADGLFGAQRRQKHGFARGKPTWFCAIMGALRARKLPRKPVGSVHGDSIGVHACDSANAWRNMALVSNARNSFACLIVGAYQTAFDRINRGGDFLNWEPLPIQRHVDEITATDAPALLGQAEEAIKGNLQAKASAIIQRYGQQGHDARPVFDLMLRYAVSEDGSLHAEKFYRTVSEEFASGTPAFRWRHLVALARVTASEYGRPADGWQRRSSASYSRG